MKLSFIQNILSTCGRKVDISSQLHPEDTSRFTNEALSMGIKFYYTSFGPNISAYAMCENSKYKEDPIININKDALRDNDDDTAAKLIIEHECDHVLQTLILSALYNGDSRFVTFQPLSYLSLSKLIEVEAYSHEFLKAYKDYRASGDFKHIEIVNSLMGSGLPANLQVTPGKPSNLARKRVDTMIAMEKADDQIIKEIILPMVSNDTFMNRVISGNISLLQPFIENNTEKNYKAAIHKYHLYDPKNDLFANKFDRSDLENYMQLMKNNYYDTMSIKEKFQFNSSIFNLPGIKKEPYQALVNQARSMPGL